MANGCPVRRMHSNIAANAAIPQSKLTVCMDFFSQGCRIKASDFAGEHISTARSKTASHAMVFAAKAARKPRTAYAEPH